MEDGMKRVVTAGMTIQDSVNAELLGQCTKQIGCHALEAFRWDQLRCLYILGYRDHPEFRQPLSYPGPLPGCYVDQTQTWMLLIGVPASAIETYISACTAHLETLAVRFTDLSHIDLAHLTGLRELDLSDNDRLLRAAGLEKLTNLEAVFLAYTRIRKIPEGLRSLERLRHLDLSGLSLEELPDWLPELGLPLFHGGVGIGINLTRTVVNNMDMSIFDQPQEVILQWFEERKKVHAGAPLNELKVVFLGDGGSGKSLIISRLLADGNELFDFRGEATPGIVITDKQYYIDNREVQVHFWDFGGQEILHSMHRMFLTNRALYVVVLNVRDGSQDDRARYWLHNIKSFAGNAPVLLVLNQMDANPNASINENDLRHMAPGVTETVKISARYYSREEFNRIFTDALLRQIGKMGETLDFFFPAEWLKVKQALQNMRNNYIHGSNYTAICEECGVKNEGNLQKELLKWFNDLGVSFCYGDDVRLEDYVILRPDWLTNAIYILLFNKLENVRNGIVPLQAIYNVLNPPPSIRDKIRVVLPDVIYTPDEVSYVLNVIRKFRLSFQINEDEEFIPMLCDRNSLPIASEYEYDPGTLEFRMAYDYLPNNVIHRLMVELRGQLDTENVWLTGARFAQKSTGLSAVVKSEGDVIKIFVRCSNRHHSANTYLSMIKATVDQINRDMGLSPPFNLVVYKADGISEEFDYDDLINALEDGEITYRSPRRRRRIPIMDILNQTGHTADVAREKLIRDILFACASMQSQRLYWNLPSYEKNSKEDIRNDCIRNLLRAKGYIVSDQTRNGASVGGNQSGELDMDIRLEPDVPWTLYEALSIAGTANISKWNAHLQILLDDASSSCLPFVFLVSYLECRREDFRRITETYDGHMRWFAPRFCTRVPSSFSVLPVEYSRNIHAVKCVYDCAGCPITVYHISVRLGN